mmetsp:Transcript_26170/g.104690  ORF Transcript_26170/g.104690 Transcript_26170/m.104690 type:complete len:108 (-) Transcript_26170:1072-1395(-)
MTAANAANWHVDELALESFIPSEALDYDDSEVLEISIEPVRHFAHVKRAVVEIHCDISPPYASDDHVRMGVAAFFAAAASRDNLLSTNDNFKEVSSSLLGRPHTNQR